jgi:peptidoglycan hydrolase CwlO-like protein
MQGTTSRFVANIVPLQNVQTNVSGQGVQQTIQTNISALQAAVASLQTSVSSLQTSLAQVQATVTALQAKVG